MIRIFSDNSGKFQKVRIFSDWDQIRDLVKSQYPKMKFEKVRGSETKNSYKIKITSNGKSREVEIPINGKSTLDNFQKATRLKVENTAKPKVSDDTIARYKGPKLPKEVLDVSYKDPKYVYKEIMNGEFYPRRGQLPKDLYDKVTKNILSGNVKSGHVISMWLSNENTKTEDLEACMDEYYSEYKDSADQFLNRVLLNPNVSDKIIDMMVSNPPRVPDQLYYYLINNSSKLPKDTLDKCLHHKELKYTILGNKSVDKTSALNLFNESSGYNRGLAASSLLTRDDLTDKELGEISLYAIRSGSYRSKDLYKILNNNPRMIDYVSRYRFNELISDDNISDKLKLKMAIKMDPKEVMNTKLDPDLKFDIYSSSDRYERTINGSNPPKVDSDWNLINTIHYLNNQLGNGTSTVPSKDLKSIYMSLRNLNVDPNKLVDSVWTKIVNAYNEGDAISNVITDDLKKV